MKLSKNLLLLILTLLSTYTGLTAKMLEKLTIKNTTDDELYVCWFYNQQEIGSFLVKLLPGKSISVKKWDMDRPTKIFFANEILRESTHDLPKTYYIGNLYTIGRTGKIIDIEIAKIIEHMQEGIKKIFYPIPVQKKRFLRSAKHDLATDDILVEIKKGNKTSQEFMKQIFDYDRLSEIAFIRFSLLDSEDLINPTNSRDQEKLQEICNKMVTGYKH